MKNENKSRLTLGDLLVCRDILETIIQDSDLIKGFNSTCGTTTRQLNKIVKNINLDVMDEL